MKTRLALALLLVLVAVLLPGAVPAHAGQIILSINSDSLGGTIFPADLSYALSQGWSSAKAYTNASISISLLAQPYDVEFPLEAFLVTQIGPGTTPADQVAYTALTASVRGVPATADPFDPTSVVTHVPLFSGLTLDAGDYYLVISTPGYTSGGEWLEVLWAANWELDININTAPGVGNLRMFNSDGPVTGYAPATLFSENLYTYAWLEVTGDPVPDPGSTLLLLGISLAGLSAWRKRCR